MPLSRASPRNVSASNHCLDRWLPKCAFNNSILRCQRRRGNRHVDVGLPHVSVPLGDLIFKNAVVTERIPRQAANLAMILVRVVAIMSEDEVGIDCATLALRTMILSLRRAPEKSHPEKSMISTCVFVAPFRKSAADALASFSRSPAPLSTHQ